MFGVLDTNHYVEMIEGAALAARLSQRADEANADLFREGTGQGRAAPAEDYGTRRYDSAR